MPLTNMYYLCMISDDLELIYTAKSGNMQKESADSWAGIT